MSTIVRTLAVVCLAFGSSAEAQSPGTMPDLQAKFITAIEHARLEYKNAFNDMARGAARPKRASVLCALLRTRRVEGWIGWVALLSTNNDGRGILSIRIAPNIHIQTWNNALSDMFDKTLLDPRGKVYAVASGLKDGDFVTFSGSFVASPVDCIGGSINSPEFSFRFHELKRNF